jgi:hypothetical protein
MARAWRKAQTAGRYRDWRQVAGYTDGDGSNHVYYSRYTLRFAATWCDSSLQQLSQLRHFLLSHGIKPAPKTTFTSGAYVLVVGNQEEVLRTARALLPFVFKKRDEFQTIADYLEDRITGTEVFRRFKALQDLGLRERNRYLSNGEICIPYKRTDGQNLGKLTGGRPRILSTAQVREIQHAHYVQGETVEHLAAKFAVSRSTAQSALSIDTKDSLGSP